MKIFDQLIEDNTIIDNGLKLATESRVYAMTYSIFLQVPAKDKEIKEKIWKKHKSIQKNIIFDKSPMMRKKNKYAAWIISLYRKKVWTKRFKEKGALDE